MTNCNKKEQMKDGIEKVIGFLENPGIEKIKGEYYEPMKELLKLIGSSTLNNY